jgi:hypothetical protein
MSPVETFGEATARAAREHTARQLEAAASNAALGTDQWTQLPDSARLLIRLAMLFEGHSSAVAGLAPKLRELAAESIKTGLVARPQWWVGLGLPGF